MYGLVQAARPFYVKFTSFLVNIGFRKCLCDPCLLKRGCIFVGLYVDDLFVIGRSTDITSFFKEVNKNYTVRTDTEVKEFIGCQFEWHQDYVILHQMRIVKKLLEIVKGEI